mmetsp:Transcript_12136/g.13914  ORF Transcript_12136/g.13914 Transcript_12136/m.13914 type:complete len:141 (+) Transcript_12136:105-527(+)|eukprot:CAMPEP_0194141932 /NCGR_PEP_ID=MMETSP0152-20130528/11278_1 /TAXON_ID=1049557 /ORGANISM="Thalassiothrix antarctica, Strain L6-D1" /LENGTH=140 /DNA_ID=CAMNT_0038840709 /DNA_START=74 /DNA_END=496 /DNA_ORIENTATION=-
MVWYSIIDTFRGEPKLPEGPTKLPQYFPVQPKGCERHSQKLFSCITSKATEKARDMEKLGYHKSFYPDVEVKPTNIKIENEEELNLPKPGDNPLDECRSLVAYYKRCCDRELKKKKNWMLTEPFRVQEEYRYIPPVKKSD